MNKYIIADVKFMVVVLFVISVFLLSNDDSLKIASMNASSIVAVFMVGIFIFDCLLKGKFVIKRHPVQKPLFLLFLWALISLLISKIDPAKAIPDEAYSYSWALGLNSPDWRGISFLLRLFLSIFAIEYIISNVNSIRKYFFVINITLLLYFTVCLFGFMQIILFGLASIEIGQIIIVPGMENFFRIGGYVGEPQTFGIILVSGYFLVIAALQNPVKEIWFQKRFLTVTLLVATIDLIFTFSVAMMVGTLVAFVFFVRKSIMKRKFLAVILLVITVVMVSSEIFYQAVIAKLLNEPFTINTRTLTWLLGTSMFIHNPLTGIGIGQSPLVNAAYIPTSVSDYVLKFLSFDEMRTPPMNTYVEWISETGVIGMLIVLSLLYSLYKLGKSYISSKEQKYIQMAYGGALLAMAIAANSSGGGFYIGFINLQFAMFVSGMILFKNGDKIGS